MSDEPYTHTSSILPENEPNNSIYRDVLKNEPNDSINKEIEQITQYLSPKKNATPCEIRRSLLEILIKEKNAKNSREICDLIKKDKTIDQKYRTNLTEYKTRGLIGNLVNRMSFIAGRTERGYYFKEDNYSSDDRSNMLEFVQKYTCTPITDANIFEIDI